MFKLNLRTTLNVQIKSNIYNNAWPKHKCPYAKVY